MYEVDRKALQKLAGIEYDFNGAYTPSTVGKKNLLTIPRNTWADQFRNLNFTNVEELRALTPETVQPKQCYYMHENGKFEPIPKKYAIVGDESHHAYAIHSDKYEPIQHSVIIEAMAGACEDTDLSLFGHFDQTDGRFNGYGTLANPDCHINLGVDNGFEDPVMLGVRFHNSHDGDGTFGGEIFGIRAVCQNYMAWGEVLGKVKIKHFRDANAKNVADMLTEVLVGFRDRIEPLLDKVHVMQDTYLNADESEAILYGVGLSSANVDNITTHKRALNPEIQDKVSVYDLYNASTAFVTYRVGGGHMVANNLAVSDKIQKLLTQSTDSLIEDGIKKREKALDAIANPKTKYGILTVTQVA